MRAFVTVVLTAVLLALAGAPHVHGVARGDHDCAACVVRGADAARRETPDVTPVRLPLPGEVAAPVEAVPVGAPMGAIPGQSPPAHA